MRKVLIGLGHLIAIGLIIIGLMSAYIYFTPLGVALDLLIISLTKKTKKNEGEVKTEKVGAYLTWFILLFIIAAICFITFKYS
ncbi:MAG: hypothetical protein WCG35_10820 [Betaproteobacteria bacterium]